MSMQDKLQSSRCGGHRGQGVLTCQQHKSNWGQTQVKLCNNSFNGYRA